MDKRDGIFTCALLVVVFGFVLMCSQAAEIAMTVWPEKVPDSVKKSALQDPLWGRKMEEIEKMRRQSATQIHPLWPSELKKVDAILRDLRADGSYRDKVLADLKARNNLRALESCSDQTTSSAFRDLAILVRYWAAGPWRRDPEMKIKLYKLLVYYIDIECKRNDWRWVGSAFYAPQACGTAYFCFFDDMEAVERGELKDPLTMQVNDLLKKVVCQAFTQPSRSDVRNPLSVEQFQHNICYCGGNFGYRPLLDAALVCRNPKMVDVVVEVCQGAMGVVSWNTRKSAFWQEGMTADGAGWGHGNQGYVAGYPLDGLKGVFTNLNRLKGTIWADGIDLMRVKTAIGFVEGGLWYIYMPDGYTLMAPGRVSMKYGPFFPVADRNLKLANLILDFLPDGMAEERGELRRYIDIMEGRAKEISGNRYFWNSDDLIHRRADYYVGINMTSARTSSTEVVNDCTSHTEFLCDGSTFLMKRPDAFNAAKGFWNYSAIPGTTVRQVKLDADYETYAGFSCVDNFAGGISDGDIGFCAFIYEKDPSPRPEKAFSQIPQKPELFGVSAHKAYFCFEDELVCLGSGIINKTPTIEGEIWTALNQAELRGPVRWSKDGGATVLEMAAPGQGRVADAKDAVLLSHDGLGYVILPEHTRAEIDITAEERRAQWMEVYPNANKGIPDKPERMRMLQMHLNHGRTPGKAHSDAYAYVVQLRCQNFDALKSYWDSKPLTILSNTTALQAVCHNRCKTVQAVFYDPSAVLDSGRGAWRADAPALVMIKEGVDGNLTVAVSDPCQNSALKELTVTTDRCLAGEGAKAIEGGTQIAIRLPGDPYCGKTVSRTFHEDVGR